MAKQWGWKDLSEEYRKEAIKKQTEKARESGYASQRAYMERTVRVQLFLHPEHDADIIAMLDEGKPLASQVKAILHEVANGGNQQK